MEKIIEEDIFQSENHLSGNDSHLTSVTRFIEADRNIYAYRQFGQKTGLPLILLQHFTGTMDDWDPMITNGFAKYGEIVIFDNRGIGSSSAETPDNIATMAQDVISFIKALGFAKVNLLGFSMGGFIAQQITLDEPDLVNKLILAGTGPKGGEGLSNSEKALSYTANMTSEEQKLYFFYNYTASSRALGKESLKRINQRQVNRDQDTSLPATLSQLKSIVGWAQTDENMISRLKRIKQPVLIVNGSNDVICPTINSYTMFQNMPDAKLSLYPDSGHGSIFQYPDLFLAEAVPFLENIICQQQEKLKS
jgi:pimeloyl-ACP methyl ester carboxylesterase